MINPFANRSDQDAVGFAAAGSAGPGSAGARDAADSAAGASAGARDAAGSSVGASAGAAGSGGGIDRAELEQKVIEVLKETYDPEIPVNIYDLGMIYNVDVKPDATVDVKMTLTSPMCPVAGTLPGEVEMRIKAIPEIADAHIELVWDPPWDRDMMSEAARLTLGFF